MEDWENVTKVLTVVWLVVQIAAKVKEMLSNTNGKKPKNKKGK